LRLKLGEVVARRSGNWNNFTKSGVFTLNFNYATTNFNTNVGVRACRWKSGLYRIFAGAAKFKDLPPVLFHLGSQTLFGLPQKAGEQKR